MISCFQTPKYKINKIPQTRQDIASRSQRFFIIMQDGLSFTCRQMQIRPDHIYFSEDIQIKIGDDLLDEIENDILNRLL